MKSFKFEANVKYNYGDTVYVTTYGRKTWFKGIIIGWKLGRPTYSIEFSNENDEEHYQKYPLPISYIVLIKDQNGLPFIINRNPTIQYGSILRVKCVGINLNYTMSISLLVLKGLAADFDGDTLNIKDSDIDISIEDIDILESAKI